MNPATLHAKILPSLLGGTSRHPLPNEWSSLASSDGALEWLSLMGQAFRFERPATPGAFIVKPEIQDDRKIIADCLRRPLVRMLTSKLATGHPARALARAFDRLRLRPHPFDLPAIDAFVRSNAERLGPTAQHWADGQKTEAVARSYFDPELLDESNWTRATISRRVVYLEQRRRDDADAARALLETTWAQEEAEARFRLLQVLQTRLTTADQPFLSSLEKDRAPRVRALAARFLARLGAGRRNAELAACVERIQQSRGGLLRKRTVLQLELPATVKSEAAPRWILQTFTEISFGELAGAVQVTETELIDAATKDASLLLVLALMATTERRLDLLELVVANLPTAWERMSWTGLDTLGSMTDSERQHWAEILVQPYRKEPPAAYPLWDWLHRMIDGEAPPSVMTLGLHELAPRVQENEQGGAPWLELFAAMCPASQRNSLREQLTNLNPLLTVTPLALLEILEGMENDRTHV